MSSRWKAAPLAILVASSLTPPPAGAQTTGKKPNILVLFGDDIGYWNVSAYNRGMMGYRTPSIDRIAKEGAIFTDAYAQQSCTAGRAAFITGQSPIRTGLLKVGLPGAPEGLSDKDPTIANLLKAQGYATGQFGKNHLGDRNDFIPTVHGFDEFFGNFYPAGELISKALPEKEPQAYTRAPCGRHWTLVLGQRCRRSSTSPTAQVSWPFAWSSMRDQSGVCSKPV